MTIGGPMQRRRKRTGLLPVPATGFSSRRIPPVFAWLGNSPSALQEHLGTPIGRALSCVILVLAIICMEVRQTQAGESFAQSEGATSALAPLKVGVSIKIDQVTFIDQKQENFGVVAEVVMEWQDRTFSFEQKPGGRDHRILSMPDFLAHAEDLDRTVPLFLFHNQQEQRWRQEEHVVIQPDGHVRFFERSTLTLQAPYLDFRQYPFDSQIFTLEIVSIPPLDLIEFVLLPDEPGFGDYLGEEAWILENPVVTLGIRKGAAGYDSAAATLQFKARRHIEYYVLRIFLPMLVLVAVAWVTFFLNDYSKRIDISTANLFILVAFNFVISSDLPQLGYLTFIDYILQWVFLVTAGTIIMNVFLRRLELNDRPDLAHEFDKWIVKWVLPIGYGVVVGSAYLQFFAAGNGS